MNIDIRYFIDAYDFRENPKHQMFLNYTADRYQASNSRSNWIIELNSIYSEYGISVIYCEDGYIEKVYFESEQDYMWFLMKWA